MDFGPSVVNTLILSLSTFLLSQDALKSQMLLQGDSFLNGILIDIAARHDFGRDRKNLMHEP